MISTSIQAFLSSRYFPYKTYSNRAIFVLGITSAAIGVWSFYRRCMLHNALRKGIIDSSQIRQEYIEAMEKRRLSVAAIFKEEQIAILNMQQIIEEYQKLVQNRQEHLKESLKEEIEAITQTIRVLTNYQSSQQIWNTYKPLIEKFQGQQSLKRRIEMALSNNYPEQIFEQLQQIYASINIPIIEKLIAILKQQKNDSATSAKKEESEIICLHLIVKNSFIQFQEKFNNLKKEIEPLLLPEASVEKYKRCIILMSALLKELEKASVLQKSLGLADEKEEEPLPQTPSKTPVLKKSPFSPLFSSSPRTLFSPSSSTPCKKMNELSRQMDKRIRTSLESLFQEGEIFLNTTTDNPSLIDSEDDKEKCLLRLKSALDKKEDTGSFLLNSPSRDTIEEIQVIQLQKLYQTCKEEDFSKEALQETRQGNYSCWGIDTTLEDTLIRDLQKEVKKVGPTLKLTEEQCREILKEEDLDFPKTWREIIEQPILDQLKQISCFKDTSDFELKMLLGSEGESILFSSLEKMVEESLKKVYQDLYPQEVLSEEDLQHTLSIDWFNPYFPDCWMRQLISAEIMVSFKKNYSVISSDSNLSDEEIEEMIQQKLQENRGTTITYWWEFTSELKETVKNKLKAKFQALHLTGLLSDEEIEGTLKAALNSISLPNIWMTDLYTQSIEKLKRIYKHIDIDTRLVESQELIEQEDTILRQRLSSQPSLLKQVVPYFIFSAVLLTYRFKGHFFRLLS